MAVPSSPALLRRSMQRLSLQVNCSLLGRAALSPKTSVAALIPASLPRQSGSWRALCATTAAEIDPCEFLMQKHFSPLFQQKGQLQKQMEQLERKKLSIEASIADCAKKIAAARDQEVSQKAKEDEHHKHAARLQSDLEKLVVDRDAKGSEYARKVEEVGLDEAEKKLEEIRLRPTVQQRGPLLQKYAELHCDVLATKDKIKVAHAAAAKANQIASDLRSNTQSVQSQEEGFKSELNDVKQDLVDVQTAVKNLTQEINQAEFQASRMRKAAAWAQRVSPFIVPSVDTLPMLVLQRHQAIQIAAASLGMSSSRVLLDLECVAAELKDFPGIENHLKVCGYSAADLWRMEFSLMQLKSAGFSASEMLQIGISIEKLTKAGFNASELKQAGVEAKELQAIGFSAKDLKAAGFPASALVDAGFTASQLKCIGYDASVLRNANLSALELKEGGFLAAHLLQASFTPQELKAAGFEASQLRKEGLTPVALMEAGFKEEELLDAGFSHVQARAAVLRSHGVSAVELLASEAFTVTQLRDAGWGTREVVTARLQAAVS